MEKEKKINEYDYEGNKDVQRTDVLKMKLEHVVVEQVEGQIV